MIGTPFAADAQSGWLSLPTMLASWAFGCGGGPAGRHRRPAAPGGARPCLVPASRGARAPAGDGGRALARDGHGRLPDRDLPPLRRDPGVHALRPRGRLRLPERRRVGPPPAVARPRGPRLGTGRHRAPVARARHVHRPDPRLRGGAARARRPRRRALSARGARARAGPRRVPAPREPRDPRPPLRVDLALQPARRLRGARGDARQDRGDPGSPDPDHRGVERMALRPREHARCVRGGGDAAPVADGVPRPDAASARAPLRPGGPRRVPRHAHAPRRVGPPAGARAPPALRGRVPAQPRAAPLPRVPHGAGPRGARARLAPRAPHP
ncbi:MAG: hypothetical protein KatS3mg014_0787 [Actinomycetota bacterium]|nr:MAG: hypothetical protein KatS3mg014_0787 [Actinomycetota bacterium]